MNRKALATAGALLTASALLLTGCAPAAAPSGDAGAAGDSKVTLYSTVKEQATGVIVDAAASLSPALDVNVITGGSTAMIKRIEAENGTNTADFYYSTAPDLLDVHAALFAPYEPAGSETIPEEHRHPGKPYTVVNLLVTALMVNTQVIDDHKAPQTWQELTDPKWKGKIITADPADSTTAYTALFGAYRVLGEEGFKKLAANLVVTDNSATTYTSVQQGEYAITLGYESNVYPFIAGGQAGIELVYPTDGTFVMEDAAAIVAKAANPTGAQRLFDAILSKDAQEDMLRESYRRPVRNDIDVSAIVDLPATSSLKIVPIDDSSEESVKTAFLALWDTAKP